MDTKKILIYGGGALVFGAVTFFVWSFFQKPIIPIGNTTIGLGSTSNNIDKTNDTSTNDSDLSIYSDLDKFIHKPV
jgi:hypothetical protein